MRFKKFPIGRKRSNPYGTSAEGVARDPLGSGSLQLQKGLTESLAGRFELMRTHQWTYHEWHCAFKFNLDRYLIYGGYPAPLLMKTSLIAGMPISKIHHRIGCRQGYSAQSQGGQPRLFRQAFEILCRYPAQEMSYTKLLGSFRTRVIPTSSNTISSSIPVHSSFITEKYSAKDYLSRGSSPKILVSCPALYTMHEGPQVLADPAKRGEFSSRCRGPAFTAAGRSLLLARETKGSRFRA